MLHKRIICLLILGIAAFSAHAQGNHARIGVLNSPKAFGITVAPYEKDADVYNTVTLCADMEGIFLGTNRLPGIKLIIMHENVLRRGTIPGDDVQYAFYWGSGFSGGYVKDFDSAAKNHGAMASLCADVGIMFIFPDNIDISIDFLGEFGFHLRRDETYDMMDLSWYANGVFKSLIPQLSLYIRF